MLAIGKYFKIKNRVLYRYLKKFYFNNRKLLLQFLKLVILKFKVFNNTNLKKRTW